MIIGGVTFLGLEVGSWADLLSAFGTISAVITSLYFARSWNKNYVRFYIADNDTLVINNLSTCDVALKIIKGSKLLKHSSRSLIRLRPVNVTKESFIRDMEELGPHTERLDYATIQLNEEINKDGVIVFHDQVRNIMFKVKITKKNKNKFRIIKQGHIHLKFLIKHG